MIADAELRVVHRLLVGLVVVGPRDLKSCTLKPHSGKPNPREKLERTWTGGNQWGDDAHPRMLALAPGNVGRLWAHVDESKHINISAGCAKSTHGNGWFAVSHGTSEGEVEMSDRRRTSTMSRPAITMIGWPSSTISVYA